MTLSEQQRTGSSARAQGDDGPRTASFDMSAFGATELRTGAFDPRAHDPETAAFEAPSGETETFSRMPAHDEDATSWVPAYDDDAAPTSWVPAHDDGDATSWVPAHDTSRVPAHDDAAPTSWVPADDDEPTALAPAVTPDPEVPDVPEAAPEPLALTPPQVVIGSRGTRSAAPSAATGAAGVGAPETPPARTARTTVGPRGVMLRLLLVLVLLAGATGAVVVTEPQILTGFGTSTGLADGPLTTLAPSPPEVTGVAPPGGLLPGMLLPPPPPGGAPLGAPPPLLAPGQPVPLGAPALPAPGAAGGLVGPGGPGIGDVLGALFDAGKGDFASHFDNSGGSGLIEYGYYPSIVRNPLAPSRQAFQFALGPGGKRSEVLPVGPGTQPVDGEQQFVRYSAILSPGFPVNTSEFNIILQWHHQSNTGSPPLALQVERGQLMMVSGGDDFQSIGPVPPPGQPINLTMQVRFSSNPALASVTVWRDGRPTGVTDWHPVRGTMFTPTAYLKMGMYRSQSIAQGGALTITDLKIGQTPNAIGGIGPLAQR